MSTLKGKVLRTNRLMGWILTLAALISILTGYGNTRGLFDRYLAQQIHLVVLWVFVGLFVSHLTISLLLTRYEWAVKFRRIGQGRATPLLITRLIQRTTAWLVALLGMIIIFAGFARYYPIVQQFYEFTPHIQYDMLMIVTLMVHVASGAYVGLKRHGFQGPRINVGLVSVTALLISLVIFIDALPLFTAILNDQGGPPDLAIGDPLLMGSVKIGGESYTFNPLMVETIRPDVFKPGVFSLFDVIVHLDNINSIDLAYHFNVSLNTHVIDSINGESNWWYYAYYSGGWQETNVYRMDHYLWKNKTTLVLFQEEPSQLSRIYETFSDEIVRRAMNNGSVVIPYVSFVGWNFSIEFYDVEVVAHNLRDDLFQPGVITAIDTVLTLGDTGHISYQLQWYDSIARADPVGNYWVEGINNNLASGGCGFVYESGSNRYPFFSGNHIHLPSDARVINSPQYVEYFWICL